MRNGLLLGKNGLLYYVINGNDPAQCIVLEYRQVPDIFIGQQLHTEIDGILRSDMGEILCHDLGHPGIRRRFSL